MFFDTICLENSIDDPKRRRTRVVGENTQRNKNLVVVLVLVDTFKFKQLPSLSELQYRIALLHM